MFLASSSGILCTQEAANLMPFFMSCIDCLWSVYCLWCPLASLHLVNSSSLIITGSVAPHSVQPSWIPPGRIISLLFCALKVLCSYLRYSGYHIIVSFISLSTCLQYWPMNSSVSNIHPYSSSPHLITSWNDSYRKANILCNILQIFSRKFDHKDKCFHWNDRFLSLKFFFFWRIKCCLLKASFHNTSLRIKY